MTKRLLPLLHVGAFGTHVIEAPSGAFIFAGTVPEYFRGAGFDTRTDAVIALLDWYTQNRDDLPADCTPGPELDAMIRGGGAPC